MTSEVKKFKLKVRNTQRLKRDNIQFKLREAQELEKEIDAMQKRIDELEVAALQNQTLTVDIVGKEF